MSRKVEAVLRMVHGARETTSWARAASRRIELRERKQMATLECSEAERLLWLYIKALGEVRKAHEQYVGAVRSGPLTSISPMSRKLTVTLKRARDARHAFQ